jgi:hypothetical protein
MLINDFALKGGVSYMAWMEPLAIGLLGVGFILVSLLLIGMIGLIKDQNRKFNVLLSNYKADLEMVMLHAHNFDEFIKQTEEAMKQDDKKKPVETYYIT